MFNDLLLEREDAKLTVEEEKLLTNVTEPTVIEEIKTMNEKLRQYNSVGLNLKLVERGWCSNLSHLLVTKVLKNQGSNIKEQRINHDVADKVLNAVSAVSDQCETQFKRDESFRTVLKNLLDDYQFLVNNDYDSLFEDIYKLLSKLYSKFVI